MSSQLIGSLSLRENMASPNADPLFERGNVLVFGVLIAAAKAS